MAKVRLGAKRMIKLWILRVAKALGLFHLSRWLTRDSFIVIGWHGVSIGDEYKRFPGYFVQPETLRSRLDFLSRHFTIVPLETALRQHAAGHFTPNQVVLTFDDGLYDLKHCALPELNRFEAPATFYLISDTTQRSERSIGVNSLIRDAFLTTRLVELDGETVEGLQDTTWNRIEDRHAAADQCVAHMRGMECYSQRRDYAKSVVELLGMRWNAIVESKVWGHLRTDEIREMIPRGIDFQLHSRNHNTVTELGALLGEDTRICREDIERETHREARDYCYPSGIWLRKCWPALEEVGVRSAVTCKLGPNFNRTPPLALRRYIDTNTNTQLEFEALASNFLWLLHVALHPSRWYECTEAIAEPSSLY